MRPRGFTLIELLVVISIIALLSSIVLSSLDSARAKARDARRIEDLLSIRNALELYFHDNGAYPSTGGLNNVYYDPGCIGTSASGSDVKTSAWIPGLAPTYISSLPRDPNPDDRARGTSPSVACYMYSSDGISFVLSAWATVETGPQTTRLYSRAGYREAGPPHNGTDIQYYCNHLNIGGAPADYYKYSYTITNVACTW